MTELSSVVSLVAVQFLLYAVGWWLCSLLIATQRPALAHWAAFMLFTGLAFGLLGLRGEPRTWHAFVGANLLFVSGLVALRRGLEHFVGVAPRDREHALTWGAALLLLLAMGPAVEHAAGRVIAAYGMTAWILGRAAVDAARPLSQEFGPSLMRLLALPAVLLVLVSVERLVRQGLALDHPLELHRLDDRNRVILYGYLVGAAMFNFSFMGLVVTRLLQRLRHLSQSDPLTGLLNRRALETHVLRELQRVRREHGTLALLSVDIDHFKHVNDMHGHPAGDDVLVQTAQRLLQVARQSDVVARTGGEEFVLLMPSVDEAGALAAAERLRRSIAEQPFRPAGVAGGLALTVSIGVALAGADEAEAATLLRRADRALYRAKREGRDRVAT